MFTMMSICFLGITCISVVFVLQVDGTAPFVDSGCSLAVSVVCNGKCHNLFRIDLQ